MKKTIPLHLTFLEPFRIVPHGAGTDKYKERGMSFARWTSPKIEDKGKGESDKAEVWYPLITGSLLRSAMLRAAEELLGISGGAWNGAPCCGGSFENTGKKPEWRKRKRPTLIAGTKEQCSDGSFCPYCYVLGRDSASFMLKNLHLSEFEVFENTVSAEPEDPGGISRIASPRMLNRVDYKEGKAHDYFRIWEVVSKKWWKFSGHIEIKREVDQGVDLLLSSLRFVDKLCGAICVIELGTPFGTEEKKELESSAPSPLSFPSRGEDDPKSAPPLPVIGAVEGRGVDEGEGGNKAPHEKSLALASDTAGKVFELFDHSGGMEKLRSFADAARALRHKSPDIKLPLGKDDGHFIYDDVRKGEDTLRRILIQSIQSFNSLNVNNEPGAWTAFCCRLGQRLYELQKDKTGGMLLRGRMLGEAEYYSRHGEAGPLIHLKGGACKEWIFTGRLRVETPFFFGTETKGGEQTSLPILLDQADGKYRIPRSVLRGIFGRDLRVMTGTGCRNELGGSSPCVCEVCLIMRHLTFRDTKSDYAEPPDFRHRIRRNPFTGTVDHDAGALFDIEVGPEGIAFPCEMRFRRPGSHNIPEEMNYVLNLWADGMAFFGGSSGTGKGRFKLENVKVFKWELNKDSLKGYLDNCGLRGYFGSAEDPAGILKDYAGVLPGLINEQDGVPSPKKKDAYAAAVPWRAVSIELKVESPLLAGDSIEALFDEGNHDIVVFRKRLLCENTKESISNSPSLACPERIRRKGRVMSVALPMTV